MIKIKTEPENLNESNSKCAYCRTKLTSEKDFLTRIDQIEAENMNLKQQIQNMQLDLDEKDSKFKMLQIELKLKQKIYRIKLDITKKHNAELLKQIKSSIEAKKDNRKQSIDLEQQTTNDDDCIVILEEDSTSRIKSISNKDGQNTIIDSKPISPLKNDAYDKETPGLLAAAHINIKKELSSLIKQKLHDCQKCKRKFLTLPGLMIHKKYFHKKKEQINIFNKNNGDQLNTRIKSENSTPIICKLCSKIFSNKFILNRHMSTVHEKQKKFKCHICNKFVSHSNALSDHIQSVHKKLKPHQCSFCGKQFSSKGNLKQHIDHVHKNLKEHVCHICNKGFSTMHYLKMHIECVHEKIKRHICQKCNKRFGVKSHLTRHLKTVH